jgi:hypothetical protein
VKFDCAAYPRTAPHVLLRLASSADSGTRLSVAWNPNAPAEALARLAGDEVLAVRKAAAKHPRTPCEVLAALARDLAWEVRAAVANNAAVGTPLLALLARDPAWEVRAAACAHPGAPAEARAAGPGRRVASIRTDAPPSPPEGVLRQWAESDDPWVRARAAADRSTPADVLVALAGDREHIVRQAVMWNAAAPGEALARAEAAEERWWRHPAPHAAPRTGDPWVDTMGPAFDL